MLKEFEVPFKFNNSNKQIKSVTCNYLYSTGFTFLKSTLLEIIWKIEVIIIVNSTELKVYAFCDDKSKSIYL